MNRFKCNRCDSIGESGPDAHCECDETEERLTAERDAYRSALVDLVMWTHPDKRNEPHMETVRIRARELLKNGPVRP